jgi:site-specific DNA-methyltransferase (adenine-specific)
MEYMATQPDNVFDLIIADPPYYEVKGCFDFAWPTFDAYLADVERWASEMARVLNYSGSLFWWGSAKKIAYSQVILDRYFNLENSMVWDKFDSQSNRIPADEQRCFISRGERVLYYSAKGADQAAKGETEYTAKSDESRGFVFEPLRAYLVGERDRAGFKTSSVDAEWQMMRGTKSRGGMAGHWFGVSQWELPTKENYKWLRNLFNSSGREYEYLRREYEDLRREYEYLHREYEELRRPFDNSARLTDVLTFGQEAHLTKDHDHPTKKGIRITAALINATKRKGGRAFVPFVGSGTEAIELHNAGMRVSGCELSKGYYDAMMERFDNETRQSSFF